MAGGEPGSVTTTPAALTRQQAGTTVRRESTDLTTIEGLVGAGLGVAILPEQLTGASSTIGIALAAAGAERVVGLTWRTDRALPPAAARFLAFLRRAGPFD
jgi:LysR family transcriptional regulator, transcription activator of glutamate synthase operon